MNAPIRSLPLPLPPPAADFRSDVLRGLARRPRQLSPKYLYDAQGSALFERICALPEYYLTRCELAIMRGAAPRIAQRLGRGLLLVEIGCGHAAKTMTLLDALEDPAGYVPVDLSPEQLERTSAAVTARFPHLQCMPLQADFTQPFALPAGGRAPQRIAIYFPGSTIGNFDPADALHLLLQLRSLAGADGALVIGVDLLKPAEVLVPAYDDAQGVTAAFNLNLLARINRELGADFDLASFAHRARFVDAAPGRIEMHLESLRDQIVRIGAQRFGFRRGETIHTENSWKYSAAGFQQLAARAGFGAGRLWRDPQGLFAIHDLVAAGDRGT